MLHNRNMAYFIPALETVIQRTFGGKNAALAAATTGMYPADISKLLKGDAPLSADKLAKLLTAEGMTEADKHLLSQSAVRDFVGEDAYRQWFVEPQDENILREQLGGPTFQGLFPLSPRAEQVIRYIITHAHEPDTTTALELIGKFLALPEPL